jgi:hypothetical protein
MAVTNTLAYSSRPSGIKNIVCMTLAHDITLNGSDKHSSLFIKTIIDEEESLHKIVTHDITLNGSDKHSSLFIETIRN